MYQSKSRGTRGSLNSTSKLAIAELVIYLILTPIVLYLLARHGKHGLIGWVFLLCFCSLRVVADGFQISDGLKQSKGESFSATGSIINSVGVSPLMLALTGILMEAAHYAIPEMKKLLKIVLHVFFHVTIATGIVLAAVGASNLAKPQTSSNKYSTDNGLIQGGYLILLMVMIILAVFAVVIGLRAKRQVLINDPERQRRADNPLAISPGRLVIWTMIALVFTAARVVYGVVYAFSNNKAALSPATAGFAIKFILVFGVQLVAAICLIIGGWTSIRK